jgi:hypothetical protein
MNRKDQRDSKTTREDTIKSGQLGSNCIQLLIEIDVERVCKSNGKTILNKVFMSFS